MQYYIPVVIQFIGNRFVSAENEHKECIEQKFTDMLVTTFVVLQIPGRLCARGRLYGVVQLCPKVIELSRPGIIKPVVVCQLWGQLTLLVHDRYHFA
jgi:hypothetical protein